MIKIGGLNSTSNKQNCFLKKCEGFKVKIFVSIGTDYTDKACSDARQYILGAYK